MKKYLIVSLTAFTLLVSCTKENVTSAAAGSNGTSPAALSVAAVNSTVATGTWRVTSFIDNGDETYKFAGYAFSFGANGVVTAVKAGSTISGTWSTGNDDSQVKLYLNFSAPANFAEISDDWHVTERTETKIRLIDVSGGNGGTDYLTFEKN